MVTVTFRSSLVNEQEYTLIYRPVVEQDVIRWNCEKGSLPNRYRSPNCRSKGDGGVSGSGEGRIYSNDGKTSVTVPHNWNTQVSLNEEAILQAALPAKERYLIVISDAKSDFDESVDIVGFNELITDNFSTALDDMNVLHRPQPVAINGIPGYSTEITGTVSGVKVHYLVTALESQTHFYQILTWTLPSRINDNRAVFERIVGSFREESP